MKIKRIQGRGSFAKQMGFVIAVGCLANSLLASGKIPFDVESDAGLPTHDDYAMLKDGNFKSDSFVQFRKGGDASVTLDLGEVQPVDRLLVVGRSMAGVPNISSSVVEVSADGKDWKQVAERDNAEVLSALAGTSRNSGGTELIAFEPQKARYVRFILTDPTRAEQIGELMLFSQTGPRVSLVDRGEKFNNTSEGLTEKYPFYLVDGNREDDADFVLYSGSRDKSVSGNFTLRVDGPEYEKGWDQVVLNGRGTQPVASNPSKVVISVADSPSGPFTQIHEESFEAEPEPWQFDLKMPSIRHEKYVMVSWLSEDDQSFAPLNVQFTEADVVPAGAR